MLHLIKTPISDILSNSLPKKESKWLLTFVPGWLAVSALINILHASCSWASLMLCQLERRLVGKSDKHRGREAAGGWVLTFRGCRSDCGGMRGRLGHVGTGWRVYGSFTAETARLTKTPAPSQPAQSKPAKTKSFTCLHGWQVNGFCLVFSQMFSIFFISINHICKSKVYKSLESLFKNTRQAQQNYIQYDEN